MEDHKIITLEDRAREVLAKLVDINVDDKLEALGESIIIKESFYARLKTLNLARLDFSKVNNSNNNEYRTKLDSIKQSGSEYKLSVVSVGEKVESALGAKLNLDDEIILDLVNSSYGIYQLKFKENTRDIVKVCSIFGSDFMTGTLIAELLNIDKNENMNIFNGESILINNYIKVSPTHFVCRIKK
jgi:hypothetical protein